MLSKVSANRCDVYLLLKIVRYYYNLPPLTMFAKVTTERTTMRQQLLLGVDKLSDIHLLIEVCDLAICFVFTQLSTKCFAIKLK